MTGFLAALLLALPSAAEPAAPPVTVCASLPMDQLPAGTAFGVAKEFLAKARDYVARGPEQDRSPFEPRAFPVVWDQRAEWMDGSQVSLSCTLDGSLHQLEQGAFKIRSARLTVEPHGKPIVPNQRPWYKVVYDLEDGDMGFPLRLTCESAQAAPRRAGGWPALEQARLPVWVLENLLAASLPLRVRTETAPPTCPAGR